MPWQCTQCTFDQNLFSEDICRLCATPLERASARSEWTCALCTLVNASHSEWCKACASARPEVSAAATAAAPPRTAWCCVLCTFDNSPLAHRCEACDTPRAALSVPKPEPPPGWTCPVCTFHNAPDVAACNACEFEPRPPKPIAAAAVQQDWTCVVCTLVNSATATHCSACSAVKPARAAAQPASWTCAACTFLNSQHNGVCGACLFERPDARVAAPPRVAPAVAGSALAARPPVFTPPRRPSRPAQRPPPPPPPVAPPLATPSPARPAAAKPRRAPRSRVSKPPRPTAPAVPAAPVAPTPQRAPRPAVVPAAPAPKPMLVQGERKVISMGAPPPDTVFVPGLKSPKAAAGVERGKEDDDDVDDEEVMLGKPASPVHDDDDDEYEHKIVLFVAKASGQSPFMKTFDKESEHARRQYAEILRELGAKGLKVLERGRAVRVASIERGNVYELRHIGKKGYRIYFTVVEGKFALLQGGHKDTQEADIRVTKARYKLVQAGDCEYAEWRFPD